MNGRTQFTFYESFYKALARIRKGADRAKAYDIIVRFALYGEEPELESMPESVAIAYELVRPTLEASRRKSEAGRKGGSNYMRSKPEAKQKQTGSKSETNGSKPEAKQKQVQDIELDIVLDRELMLKETSPYGEVKKSPPPAQAERKPFRPPTVQDVGAYCQKAGLSIDAQRFVDYYASKGWRIGGELMADWRAAVRNWAKRDQEQGRPVRNGPSVSKTYEDDDWAVIQAAARGGM